MSKCQRIFGDGDGGQDGVGPFGRDCGANYVNGVQWSVPLTALTLLLLATQPNLGRFALQCTPVSGTLSRFGILLSLYITSQTPSILTFKHSERVPS